DVAAQHEQRAIDLVVMSGDLAFSGSADEFASAEATLLKPLLEVVQLPRSRLVLVPGNHDVDRGRVEWDLEEGLRIRLSNREAANELLVDADRREKAARRLEPWHSFHTHFYADDPPTPIPPFGCLHKAETSSGLILAAGLSSAWRCAGDDDRGLLIV